MSEDKRKRSRVQGGWAGNGGKSQPPGATVATASSVASSRPIRATFQPDQQLPAVATTKVIDAAGTHDISTGPTGISTIKLLPGFVEAHECPSICRQLLDELPWSQETVTEGGESYLQPRMTAWFGDVPYAYSGIRHEPNATWPAVVLMLKERIELNIGLQFNSLLANLYRDGHDHVSWHCDDEPSLGKNPVIASLSFGDTRNFELRKKPPAEVRNTADYVYTEYIKVPLDTGSLLIMDGAVQSDWQHRVPREYHDRGPRINLTFRVTYPEP